MSICSVRPVLAPGMGDLRPFFPPAPPPCMGYLRPFCPGLAPFGVMSPCPISAPDFPPVPQIFLVPALAREVSGFVRIKKNKKILSPAAAPRKRLRRRDEKVSIHAEKPLCIVHNGFFLFVWKCFLVFFHAQILQRPVSCIIFRHEFPAPLLLDCTAYLVRACPFALN